MRAVVVGGGAVGARAARQLLAGPELERLVVVDTDAGRAEAVVESLGAPAETRSWSDLDEHDAIDVVILATPGAHSILAEQALMRGAHVVSVGEALTTVDPLLELHEVAQQRDRSLVVGAGFTPGLSCVLARHGAAGLDSVQEIHVARVGTGGPACARQHHDCLGRSALDWRDGRWSHAAAGSGRELCWFPEPVGGRDCYRAGLADAVVLVPAFPGVERVTVRVAASRRDRLTVRLPLLRKPHAEGLLGALRVEVRGRRGRVPDVVVLGALDRPALAAGAVAAVAAEWAADGRLARTGAGGLAALVPEPLAFLQELAGRGVRAAAFDGAAEVG